MSQKKVTVEKGIIISPDSVALEGIEGELKVGSVSKKIETTLDSVSREVLTNSQVQTVTNKVLDIDNNTLSNVETDNLKAGVLNTSTVLAGATDTQLPSALAVKTYVDDKTAAQNEASEITIDAIPGLVATNVQEALEEIDTNLDNHIADAVDAHDASAISVAAIANLTATEAQAAFAEHQDDIDDLVVLSGVAANATDLGTFTGTTIPDNSDIKEAIQAVETGLEFHVADAVAAHQALAINNIPSGNLASTDQQGVNNELQGDIDTINSTLSGHISDTTTHGTTGDIVGTSDAQTLTNKIITGADFRTPIRSDVKQDTYANLVTYALTATNGQLCFATDTKLMYQIVDTLLVDVGSGGGTSDPDVMFAQNFDDAALSDFTQTGLSLDETDSMHGTASAKLTHGGSNQSFAQTIAVDRKFRGTSITASMVVKSTATSGNLTFTAYDVTNSATLSSQQIQTDSVAIASLTTTISTTSVTGFSNSDINTLKVGMSVTGTGIAAGTEISAINTSTNTVTLSANATASGTVSLRFSALPKTVQLGFTIPASCSSVSYTITALPETGSPETYIDDILFASYWLGTSNQGQTEYTFEVPVITEWQSYTPTFTGFGTVSTQSFYWRQNGSSVEIEGRFTAGTTTATEARISLPNGYTSNNSYVTLQQVGTLAQNAVGAASFYTTIEPSVQYLTLSVQTASLQALSKINGSTALSTGGIASVQASIQISGLSATEERTVTTVDLVPAKAVLGNSTFDVPAITEWASYTPTLTALGTPSSAFYEWRQVGSNIEVQGKFTSTGGSASEARISLPNSYTTANTGTIYICGEYARGNAGGVSAHGGFILCEPSVAYVTISSESVYGSASINSLAKSNGTAISASEIMSFKFSVPVAGLSATSEITVSGTQQLLSTNRDSMVRVDTTNGYGSSATKILRFTNITQSVGSDILYTDSATAGGSFTVQTSGVYSLELNYESSSANQYFGVSKNSTTLTTSVNSLTLAERLTMARTNTANYTQSTSWVGYLVAGDVIRAHTEAGAIANPQYCNFTAAKQGSVSVLNTTSDQKIEIPTSELRFNGASARGAVATGVVKFDNITSIRGDAFTVTNTSNDGTYVTMTKAGKLFASANVYFLGATGNAELALTKNSTNLATNPTSASEVFGYQFNASTAGNGVRSVNGTVDVNVGDIIRVQVNNLAPTANGAYSQFNLSFQEQKISVSVSNTLPQFSESDSAVAVHTSPGFGATNTTVRRYSSISTNIGNDIVFADSASLGSTFTVRTAGIYNISMVEQSSAGTPSMQILQNAATTLAQSVLSTTSGLVTISCSPYLNVGDVITGVCTAPGSMTSGGNQKFFISKVGRPNVTGVDVTPFIEIPMPEVQTSRIAQTQSAMTDRTGEIQFALATATISNNRTDIIQIVDDSANTRTKFVALKACTVEVHAHVALTSIGFGAYIYKNGAIYSGETNVSTANYEVVVSSSMQLQPGEYFSVVANSTASNNGAVAVVTFNATANSDQIVTPLESFSTDTASLTYAGSGTYTLSTLANAPVGTFITYTVAASTTDTATQTTTAPTQTTSSMNVSGIQITKRNYATLSTAALPAKIAIQIGKGMRGVTILGYITSTKGDQVSLDGVPVSASVQTGLMLRDYNEATGVLVIDGASVYSSSVTTNTFYGIQTSSGQLTSNTSAYLTINASKSPALAGVPLLQPRIATIKDVKAGSTDGGTFTSGAWQTRTLNTLVDNTGIVSSLASNQFTLVSGEYYIESSCPAYFVDHHKAKLRNITDSTDVIMGSSEFCDNVTGGQSVTRSHIVGSFTITSTKVFELQHRCGVTNASTGFGIASGFVEDEVFSICKITKIK